LLQQEGLSRPVKCLGIQDRFVEQGSRQELLTRYGLDSEGIYRAASRFLQEQKVERSL
jgi:deoxyxylulose-5-phosphate synthase